MERRTVIARKQIRYGVQLPVVLRDRSGHYRGTVVNLSIEGCAVLADAPLAPGSYWVLSIETGQPERTLDIELAVVRWSRESRCGLEFIKVRAEKKPELIAFVRLLESLSPS